MVDPAFPRLSVPREDVDVGRSPWLVEPYPVAPPVPRARRDIEPRWACGVVVPGVPGLVSGGLLDLELAA